MFHAINWLSPLQFSTFTMICGIIGFYGGVEIVGKEDKYVLRSEWLHNTGKIYERINENDRKHLEAYNSLNSKIERQTGLQEKQFESQERQEKHLEKSVMLSKGLAMNLKTYNTPFVHMILN